MKRTCLQSIINAHELIIGVSQNEPCEFHPTTKKTNYLRMKKSILLTGIVCLLLTISNIIYAQTSVILKGKVTDKITKEALSFVNVVEIDKNGRFVSGTVTDINGTYVLKVKDVSNSIQASFISYKKLTFTIGSQTTVNIELESESQSIDDIVVRAELISNDGVTKVRDRATAITRMEFKGLESVQNTTVEEMLQGRMGNVDITAMSGDPGAGMNIRIRGTSTLNANNNPLIVVNGIPYDANFNGVDLQSADIEQFGSLIDVTPEDIESIEVLKDAASTAVWGSKASNGVLMIRTKRGVRSKPKFEYTYKKTIGKEPETIPMLDGAGYARLITEEHFNVDRNAFSDPEIAFDPEWEQYNNYSQDTKWIKEITQLSKTTQHSFGVRGGGEKTLYKLSLGLQNETGTTIGTGLQKISIQSSLDYDLSTKLQFQTDVMYTRYDQDENYNMGFGKPDPRSVAYKKMPNLSVFYRDSANNVYDKYFTPASTLQGTASECYNPVAFVNLAVQNVIKDNTRALFTLRYTVIPELILSSTVTLDIFDSKTNKFLPYEAIGYIYESTLTNRSSIDFQKKSSIYTMSQLVYTPKLNNGHDFVGLARFDTEETVERTFGTETSLSMSPSSQDAFGDKHLNSFGAGHSEFRSMGMFLTGNYKFKDKYILMVGAKIEGNSKFSKDARWGVFPTTSLAWRISEEPFMKSIGFIDDLKIRGSWGQSGNSPRGNYLYFNTYSAGSSISYLDLQGVKPNGVELTSLKWETIDQTNLGFSFYGLDNRLNIEFDAYRKRTLDLYFENSGIPSSTGFSSINQNNGEMVNQGLELMIDYTIIKNKIFELSVNFNSSRNENIVIDVPENYSLERGDMLNNGEYKIKVQKGKPLGGFYGYRFLGVYTTDEDAYVRDQYGEYIMSPDGETPMTMIHGGSAGVKFEGGDAKYLDVNYDGVINELDIDYLGDLNPVLMGGTGFRIKYRNFILNTFFHYKVGQKIINQTKIETENMYGYNNQSLATNWRWRRDGDSTFMPRALYNEGYNWLGSDRFVEDGSFIRLKSASISYIVPKQLCTKLTLSDIKVYATAYNLFTWTNYSGQDPDVAPPSRPDQLPRDTSKTPPSKRIMFGVTVSF